MKKLLGLGIALILASCGAEDKQTRTKTNTNDVEGKDLICSSNEDGSALQCTDESSKEYSLGLPMMFTYSKSCNECQTKVTNGVVSVSCPNGLKFQFTVINGKDGKDGKDGVNGKDGLNGKDGKNGTNGTNGKDGVNGKDGKDGTSCSVGSDGWVRCTDGTSFKLLQGPKGDKGDKGDAGANGKDGKDGVNGSNGANGTNGKNGSSCSVKTNSAGQVVVYCDDGSEEVINVPTCGTGGCGTCSSSNGCYSSGLKGNVYKIPTTTTSMPDFSLLTPISTAVAKKFDIFNQSNTIPFPWTYTPAMPHQEWYGVEFKGFILLPACQSGRCYFRVTSDDGSILSIAGITVVNNDGLHPPQSASGFLTAPSGWQAINLKYYQGPKTQISLALEISTDCGASWRVVSESELQFAQ